MNNPVASYAEWPADSQVMVVTINGDLDMYTAPILRRVLARVAGAGCGQVVVDMDGCTFLDMTGVGVLVGGLKLARERGGMIAVACGAEQVLRIFRVTGLVKVFIMAETVAEAAEALGAAAGRG
jgi:anti-sigma B factor antagonist